MNRATEDHKIWLFDLAHGNLTNSQIVKGFVKYYALNGFTVGNVQDDLVFRTHYNPSQGTESLRGALNSFSEVVE